MRDDALPWELLTHVQKFTNVEVAGRSSKTLAEYLVEIRNHASRGAEFLKVHRLHETQRVAKCEQNPAFAQLILENLGSLAVSFRRTSRQ